MTGLRTLHPGSAFAFVLGAMTLFVALGTVPAGAQQARPAGEHAVAEDAKLEVRKTEPSMLTVRLGPVHLPAGAEHEAVAQPPDRFWEISFDGWLLSYAPRLTDGAGQPVPGRLLHHVAFWHTGRSDFLCPNKQEHIFGAGGEMNEWLALPGVGYRVGKGDRIRVSTMFHNPTDVDQPEVYLEVRVGYEEEGAVEEPRSNVYPAWFDVQECGSSGYDLKPGTHVTSGEVEVPVSGRLLGVGGHLHNHGRELALELVRSEGAADDDSDDEVREIARLEPRTDEEGRILSMPVKPFLLEGGRTLEAGDRMRVTARYENPTGRRIPEGAMGIVVGYFLPDDDAEMDRFRRDPE